LLSLGVLFEIISHVLHSYPFLRLLVLRLISAVVAISFVIGVIFLITRRQADAGGFLLSVLSMERAARLLLVCLWILFTILVSRLGLTWQRYPLGIAAGFAFYAAVDLALLELRVGLNWIPDNFFVLLRSAAYNLAVGIWAYYFLHVRVQRPVEHLPSTDVGKWNHLLMHYVDQWYRRS
jgi:hypothetical protein